jgi:rhodanese-related sulfurtransferase
MEQFAAMALESNGVDACVVFARGTETWGRAYEAVLLAQRNRVSGPP